MGYTKDMVIGSITLFVLVTFFMAIDLVETVTDFAREHETWQLDELLAAVPAFALVTAWFAVRRWLEADRLSYQLKTTVVKLDDAIQQRRAMEEQIGEAYKMAAFGQLTGGLTRELNNVMQPIVTLSQLGVDHDSTADQTRDSMRRIRDAAERGIRILESPLAYPAGGAAESSDIVPSQALSELVAAAQDSFGSDLVIRTRLDTGPGEIRANREEFNAVVTSLLTNAAEAMEQQGEIVVAAESRTLDGSEAASVGLGAGDYFRITVSDNGPGMTDDVKAQAFDPFFTTRKAHGATGLGLAVAYNQVDGWGGRMSVESTPGEGAEFEVMIPRHAGEG